MSGMAKPGAAQAPAVGPEQAGPTIDPSQAGAFGSRALYDMFTGQKAQYPGVKFDFPIRPLSTSGPAWQPPMAPAYSQASVQAQSPLQSMFQYQRMLQPSLNMQGLPARMQQAIPSYLRGGVK